MTTASTSNLALRVLTFNIWGVPTATDRELRIKAIVEKILTMQLDIVGFQEVFSKSDKEFFQSALDKHFQYSHYFYSGIVGSGLMLFSRFPIVDTSFYRFRLYGKPEKIWQADFYAGKGIGFARVKTPNGILDVYNLHSLAQYVSDSKDEYQAHRASNLYECARFVNMNSFERFPVICLGDFNVRPDQFGYRLFSTLTNSIDCYAALHPEDPGSTYDPANPYVDEVTPKRIDYIFAKNSEDAQLILKSSQVSMKPDQGTLKPPLKSFSDHFGVFLEISVNYGVNFKVESRTIDSELVKKTLKEFSEILQDGLREALSRKRSYLVQSFIAVAVFIFICIKDKKILGRRYFLRYLLLFISKFILISYAGVLSLTQILSIPDEISALKSIIDEVESQIKNLPT